MHSVREKSIKAQTALKTRTGWVVGLALIILVEYAHFESGAGWGWIVAAAALMIALAEFSVSRQSPMSA